MREFRKSSATSTHHFKGRHRFEHWYCDNQVYFITASVRDKFHAFAAEEAKAVFWDRFEFYADKHRFTPWVVSLLDNHYHVLGHNTSADELGPMMRKVHGSVAKLVNDTLPQRHLPFWRTNGNRDYFDGCIRDEKQCRRAYRYTLMQSRRHGRAADWQAYDHTRRYVGIDAAVAFAVETQAFMRGVPYKRYESPRP